MSTDGATGGTRMRLRKPGKLFWEEGRHARKNCTHGSIRPSSTPQTVGDPAPCGDAKAQKGLMSC